jgi:flagellar motor switch protein FliM
LRELVEPILQKQEIANLLTAINEGSVSLDIEADNQRTPNIDSTPVDLFNITHADREQFRVPNFDIILDMFCRTYSTSLTNKLQRTFSIQRTSLESSEFQDFFKDKGNLGASGIIDMPPLKHGALIILDPQLSFSLIEIMLGASSELDSPQLDRKLTTIELILLKSLFSDACRDLDRSFSQLVKIQSTLVKLENNARLVSIVEPTAEVIIGTFMVKVGDLSGELHMIFPFSTLDPLRKLLRGFLSITKANKSNWYDVIEEEILELPAVITAQSGTLDLSVSQLLDLKKGDILNIEYDPNSPLNVLVEDQHTFYAMPGTHNGKKAISLTGM